MAADLLGVLKCLHHMTTSTPNFICSKYQKENAALIRTYLPEISNAAKKYHLDVELLVAIIWHESRFKRTAVSSNRTSCGLMQINKNYQPNKECIFDAKKNISTGAKIFSEYLQTCGKNNIQRALAAYNGGCGGLKKNKLATRKYANNVYKTYLMIKKSLILQDPKLYEH